MSRRIDENRCIRGAIRGHGNKFGMHMNLPECDDNGHALGGDGGGVRGRGQGRTGRRDESRLRRTEDERKGTESDRTLT